MTQHRSHRSALALTFIVLAGTGCLPEPGAEQVGFIDVPLVATTGDVSYRLPAGTRLIIQKQDYVRVAPLDGDAASLSVDVPVGFYSFTLIDDRGATPPTWPLTRTRADGTTDIVPATLDPFPHAVVQEQQTTALTIQFRASLAEPITFALGTLQFDVDVDESVATFFQLELAGSSIATAVQLGAAAPAELAARLPATGSTAQRYKLTATTVSPWFVASPETACALATISIEAAGDAQFADLVREAQVPGQTERICIIQFSPQLARLSAVVARSGPATTPLLADLGEREYFAILETFADFTANLFDGRTLHLDDLRAAQPRDAGLSISLSEGAPGASVPWLQLSGRGTGATALTPQ